MEILLTPYLVALFWTSIFMPLGILIRNKVSFFQKFLVPASLITGFIGMVATNLGLVGYPTINGWQVIEFKVFAQLTALLFAGNFLLIGLATGRSNTEGNGRTKIMARGALYFMLTQNAVNGLLGVVGIGAVWLVMSISGVTLEPATGIMAQMGFIGGPAQAVTFASIWEKTSGMKDVVTMGLCYGSLGFIVAAFIGVPLANHGIRKGLATSTSEKGLDQSFLSGILAKNERQPMAYHTTHPASFDTMTFHVMLVGLSGFLGWGFSYVLKNHLFPPAMGAIAFGMIYLWGMICAIVVRKLVNATGNEHLVDDQLIARMNGVAVDVMIITAMMGVQLAIVGKYLIPILITIAVGSYLIYLFLYKTSQWLKELGLERFLVAFSANTGTLASSLLLLKIVDPENKHNVGGETGIFMLFNLIMILPLMMIYSMVGVKITVMQMFLLFVGIFVIFSAIIVVLKLVGVWSPREESAPLDSTESDSSAATASL